MEQEIEGCLSTVNPYPNKSMQSAISTLSEALVCDKLFNHATNDVRVAVASCICDILRIHAPDLPYEENRMGVSSICVCLLSPLKSRDLYEGEFNSCISYFCFSVIAEGFSVGCIIF